MNKKQKMRPFFSFRYQNFTWKRENFSITLSFKVVHWSKNYIFYLIKFVIQPQVKEILRPTSQQPPFRGHTLRYMLQKISEKTSPIVEPRPKVLISSFLRRWAWISTTVSNLYSTHSSWTARRIFWTVSLHGELHWLSSVYTVN